MTDETNAASLESKYAGEIEEHLARIRKPGSQHVTWRRLFSATSSYQQLSISRLARGMLSSDPTVLNAALRNLGWSWVVLQRLRGRTAHYFEPWSGYAYALVGGVAPSEAKAALHVVATASLLPPLAEDADLLEFLRLHEPAIPVLDVAPRHTLQATAHDPARLCSSLSELLARDTRGSRPSLFTFSRVPIEYLIAKSWALRRGRSWSEPSLPSRFFCWRDWQPESGLLEEIGTELMGGADAVQPYVQSLRLAAAKPVSRNAADAASAAAARVAAALGGTVARTRPAPRRSPRPKRSR